MSITGIRAARAYVELVMNDSKFTRGLALAEAEMRAFANKCTAIGTQAFGMGAAMLTPIGLSVRQFKELDDTMRLVRAVTRATMKDFQMLSDKARLLGKTTSFTSQQVAEAMANLGRAGFDTKQIDKMISHVMNLSRATQTSIAGTAEIVGNAIRQFGLEAKDAARVADVMTATANNSSQTLDDIAQSFKYAAPIAKQFGLQIEETAYYIGILANQGLKSEMAGTSLRNMLIRLTGADTQKRFTEDLKVQIRDAEGRVKNIKQLLTEANDAMNARGWDQLQRGKWLRDVFGLRAIAGGAKFLDVGDTFKNIMDAIADSGGLAERTAKQMDEGIGGAIRITISAFQELANTIGEAISPELIQLGKWLQSVANHLITFVKYNREAVVSWTKWGGILSVGGAALFAVGGIVRTVGTAIGGLHGVIKAVMIAWKALSNSADDSGEEISSAGKAAKQAGSELGEAAKQFQQAGQNLLKSGKMADDAGKKMKEATTHITAAGKAAVSAGDQMDTSAEKFKLAAETFSVVGQGIAETNTILAELGRFLRMVTVNATIAARTMEKFVKAVRAINAPMQGITNRLGKRFEKITKSVGATVSELEKFQRQLAKLETPKDPVGDYIKKTGAAAKQAAPEVNTVASALSDVASAGAGITGTVSQMEQLATAAADADAAVQKLATDTAGVKGRQVDLLDTTGLIKKRKEIQQKLDVENDNLANYYGSERERLTGDISSLQAYIQDPTHPLGRRSLGRVIELEGKQKELENVNGDEMSSLMRRLNLIGQKKKIDQVFDTNLATLQESWKHNTILPREQRNARLRAKIAELRDKKALVEMAVRSGAHDPILEEEYRLAFQEFESMHKGQRLHPESVTSPLLSKLESQSVGFDGPSLVQLRQNMTSQREINSTRSKDRAKWNEHKASTYWSKNVAFDQKKSDREYDTRIAEAQVKLDEFLDDMKQSGFSDEFVNNDPGLKRYRDGLLEEIERLERAKLQAGALAMPLGPGPFGDDKNYRGEGYRLAETSLSRPERTKMFREKIDEMRELQKQIQEAGGSDPELNLQYNKLAEDYIAQRKAQRLTGKIAYQSVPETEIDKRLKGMTYADVIPIQGERFDYNYNYNPNTIVGGSKEFFLDDNAKLKQRVSGGAGITAESEKVNIVTSTDIPNKTGYEVNPSLNLAHSIDQLSGVINDKFTTGGSDVVVPASELSEIADLSNNIEIQDANDYESKETSTFKPKNKAGQAVTAGTTQPSQVSKQFTGVAVTNNQAAISKQVEQDTGKTTSVKTSSTALPSYSVSSVKEATSVWQKFGKVTASVGRVTGTAIKGMTAAIGGMVASTAAFMAVGWAASKLIENLNKLITVQTEKQNELAEVQNKNADDNQKLARLKELNNLQHKSNEEIAEAATIVEELSKSYKGLGLQINKATGEVTGLVQATEKLQEIQEQREQSARRAAILEIKENLKRLDRADAFVTSRWNVTNQLGRITEGYTGTSLTDRQKAQLAANAQKRQELEQQLFDLEAESKGKGIEEVQAVEGGSMLQSMPTEAWNGEQKLKSAEELLSDIESGKLESMDEKEFEEFRLSAIRAIDELKKNQSLIGEARRQNALPSVNNVIRRELGMFGQMGYVGGKQIAENPFTDKSAFMKAIEETGQYFLTKTKIGGVEEQSNAVRMIKRLDEFQEAFTKALDNGTVSQFNLSEFNDVAAYESVERLKDILDGYQKRMESNRAKIMGQYEVGQTETDAVGYKVITGTRADGTPEYYNHGELVDQDTRDKILTNRANEENNRLAEQKTAYAKLADAIAVLRNSESNAVMIAKLENALVSVPERIAKAQLDASDKEYRKQRNELKLDDDLDSKLKEIKEKFGQARKSVDDIADNVKKSGMSSYENIPIEQWISEQKEGLRRAEEAERQRAVEEVNASLRAHKDAETTHEYLVEVLRKMDRQYESQMNTRLAEYGLANPYEMRMSELNQQERELKQAAQEKAQAALDAGELIDGLNPRDWLERTMGFIEKVMNAGRVRANMSFGLHRLTGTNVFNPVAGEKQKDLYTPVRLPEDQQQGKEEEGYRTVTAEGQENIGDYVLGRNAWIEGLEQVAVIPTENDTTTERKYPGDSKYYGGYYDGTHIPDYIERPQYTRKQLIAGEMQESADNLVSDEMARRKQIREQNKTEQFETAVSNKIAQVQSSKSYENTVGVIGPKTRTIEEASDFDRAVMAGLQSENINARAFAQGMSVEELEKKEADEREAAKQAEEQAKREEKIKNSKHLFERLDAMTDPDDKAGMKANEIVKDTYNDLKAQHGEFYADQFYDYLREQNHELDENNKKRKDGIRVGTKTESNRRPWVKAAQEKAAEIAAQAQEDEEDFRYRTGKTEYDLANADIDQDIAAAEQRKAVAQQFGNSQGVAAEEANIQAYQQEKTANDYYKALDNIDRMEKRRNKDLKTYQDANKAVEKQEKTIAKLKKKGADTTAEEERLKSLEQDRQTALSKLADSNAQYGNAANFISAIEAYGSPQMQQQLWDINRSFSSKGTFDAYETGGQGVATWTAEFKEQTTILGNIEDYLATMASGEYL